jgi:hypothetical protein
MAKCRVCDTDVKGIRVKSVTSCLAYTYHCPCGRSWGYGTPSRTSINYFRPSGHDEELQPIDEFMADNMRDERG